MITENIVIALAGLLAVVALLFLLITKFKWHVFIALLVPILLLAAVPGIEEVRIVVPIGNEVIPPPEGSRYLGFIFARSSDPARTESDLRAAHARLELVID